MNINRASFCLLVLAGLVSFANCTRCVAAQETFNVRSADDIEALFESEALSAGDTIVWADGEYENVELDIEGVDGAKDQPITLKAATPGAVVIRGESQFKIGAKWWVVQGFHFTGGEEEKPNAYNAFQFRSNSGKAAQHVRLNNCAFTNLKTDESTSKWVLVYGKFNQIDHCHFSGKNSKGALVTVELEYLDLTESANHQFSRNYFGSIAPQEGSDNETIRIGSSKDQNKPARCLVRENYFFGCNGEAEIISSKSSYNVFSRNTFRKCDGALVLRHGHHARVEGNFFFGDGAKNAGGIRLVDSHHVVINNYLQDLTGSTWNAAFSILGGSAPSGGQSNGYQKVENIFVAHNSILNCQRSILLNNAKGSQAPSGTIANNLISSSKGPLLQDELSTEKINWINNLMHGAPVGIEGAKVDFIKADPELIELNGMLRPNATSGALDAGESCKIPVTKDIDGQSRTGSKPDIGADEVSGASGDQLFAPLEPADVGVSFLRGEGPLD